MSRDSITEQEARQRLAAQLPTEEKVRRADHVITTDGSFDETNSQVAPRSRGLEPRGPLTRHDSDNSATPGSFAGAMRSSTKVFHS